MTSHVNRANHFIHSFTCDVKVLVLSSVLHNWQDYCLPVSVLSIIRMQLIPLSNRILCMSRIALLKILQWEFASEN